MWYTILYIYNSKIRLRTSNPPMTSSVRFNTLRKEGWSTKIHIEIPNTTNAATWNEKSNFVIQMHCLPPKATYRQTTKWNFGSWVLLKWILFPHFSSWLINYVVLTKVSEFVAIRNHLANPSMQEHMTMWSDQATTQPAAAE